MLIPTYRTRRVSMLASCSYSKYAMAWLAAPIRIPILNSRIDPETGAITHYIS